MVKPESLRWHNHRFSLPALLLQIRSIQTTLLIQGTRQFLLFPR